MSPVGRRLFKAACYVSLAVVASALAVGLALRGSGICIDAGGGGLQCRDGLAEAAGRGALVVLLVTIYTGVPSFLAVVGLFYVVRDGWRRLRRRP